MKTRPNVLLSEIPKSLGTAVLHLASGLALAARQGVVGRTLQRVRQPRPRSFVIGADHVAALARAELSRLRSLD
jgi:hypothetical protein